jgi:N-acetyl-anhydromuramyl-L-alanine amidase AmpD
MVLNENTYVLTENNYVKEETQKKQIVLAHTFNDNMRHFIGWKNRYNGNYKKTAAFTIDAAGFIYKHFEPKYKSKFFEVEDLNDKSIVILLENCGWLDKDTEKNRYITWLGNIYNKTSEVVNKRWRNNKYWDSYTTEQFDSALNLVSNLCDEFNIPKNVISHNTKINNFFDYRGVLYKSNLNKNYTDLNPSWDFDKFKQKLEQI